MTIRIRVVVIDGQRVCQIINDGYDPAITQTFRQGQEGVEIFANSMKANNYKVSRPVVLNCLLCIPTLKDVWNAIDANTIFSDLEAIDIPQFWNQYIAKQMTLVDELGSEARLFNAFLASKGECSTVDECLDLLGDFMLA